MYVIDITKLTFLGIYDDHWSYGCNLWCYTYTFSDYRFCYQLIGRFDIKKPVWTAIQYIHSYYTGNLRRERAQKYLHTAAVAKPILQRKNFTSGSQKQMVAAFLSFGYVFTQLSRK